MNAFNTLEVRHMMRNGFYTFCTHEVSWEESHKSKNAIYLLHAKTFSVYPSNLRLTAIRPAWRCYDQ